MEVSGQIHASAALSPLPIRWKAYGPKFNSPDTGWVVSEVKRADGHDSIHTLSSLGVFTALFFCCS